MICIAKAVLVASAIMAIVMTPVVLNLVAINLNHNTEKEATPWEYSAFSPSSE